MAKKKAKKKNPHKKQKKSFSLKLSQKQKVVFGAFLLLSAIALLIAFTSFLFYWKADQSVLSDLSDRAVNAQNSLNKFGAKTSHFFIYKGFGVASYSLAVLIGLTGFFLFFNMKRYKKLLDFWLWGLFVMIWVSTTLGFVNKPEFELLGGTIGIETNDYLQHYLGFIGTLLLLAFVAVVYLVVRLDITPDLVGAHFKRKKKEVSDDIKSAKTATQADKPTMSSVQKSGEEKSTKPEKVQPLKTTKSEEKPKKEAKIKKEKIVITSKDDKKDDVAMEVETAEEEEVDETDQKAQKIVEDFGEFDPTLELKNFQFPSVDLLKDYSQETGITIDQEELEENKDNIVNTLKNYKIGISEIKATVGPTVTLYEIVPEAGIRISKIRNLEDDIALSLAALGIRIIAPIPGRGTIGIEVPNKNPSIVSMRSVAVSPKFKNAEMQLPLALGKTISNETFVVDLAQMPHLLMAGATGQGKSVGLNAILTSLLYQKHPAEIKFVLVDPKKVELTLYNKIERHYLAKLPDKEEAIITDNSQVINTLNSLTKEMDNRYDLLKKAMVRNIKEYNVKFKQRKLNPENGHKFMPYIVLVIDEFADLIMTAGKDVETPIARLAQLARAIGIHLIIATQRPSVNVITGMIKANFPARIAFRVTSKIDSRTILDNGGAEQLIGRGDMLYTQGTVLTRLQCAFVDTPEIERLTDFIGSQRAYPSAFRLPEYESEESGTGVADIEDERDAKFNKAAEIIVSAQQGSASLLQRKLKVGYNRAGRMIDQLEAAGVVGPFQGSKARDVLIPDLMALEEHLKEDE